MLEKLYLGRTVRKQSGAWPWILQRVTGLAVGILIFLHLWIKHFGNPGKVITFSGSAERLHQPLWLVMGFLMVAALLFHSLNGGRNTLMDYVTGGLARRMMSWCFLVAGIVFFFVYLFFLIPFIRA